MRPSSLSQICLFPPVHSKAELRFSSHRPLSHFTSFPVQSVIPTHGSPMHNLNILGRAAFTRNGQLSIRPVISMAIVPLTCLDLGMSSKERLNYGKKNIQPRANSPESSTRFGYVSSNAVSVHFRFTNIRRDRVYSVQHHDLTTMPITILRTSIYLCH